MADLEDLSLGEVLERLYKAEINAGIASFWDAGYRVWIGDESNGIKREAQFSVGKGENDLPTWAVLWQAVSLFLMENADDLYPSWDVERQPDEM